MKIEFDKNKSNKNAEERGLHFDLARKFDWESAFYNVDDRKQYPEQRIVAIGYLEKRLHVICFT